MASTPQIQANFEALSQLATRIDAVHSAFEQMPQHPSPDEGAIGEPTLATEIDRFFSDWSQGRQRIELEIQNISKVVLYALQEYIGAERKILSGASISAGGVEAMVAAGGGVLSGVVAGIGQSANEAVAAGASAGTGAASLVGAGYADTGAVIDVENGTGATTPLPTPESGQGSGVVTGLNAALTEIGQTERAVRQDEQ
jgi:hypothetical protein